MKNRYLEDVRNAGNDPDLQESIKIDSSRPKAKKVMNRHKMQYKAGVFEFFSGWTRVHCTCWTLEYYQNQGYRCSEKDVLAKLAINISNGIIYT